MTRVSQVVVVDGVAKTRMDWCRHFGITTGVISQRMTRGRTLEEAIRLGGRKQNARRRQRAEKAQAIAQLPKPDVELRQWEDSYYYVAEDGRVWNDLLKRWMTISMHTPNPNSPGVQYARVRCGGSLRYVHTVVAATWLENPKNLPWVLHKDHNSGNNHKENLQWASAMEVRAHRSKLRRLEQTARNSANGSVPK